MAINGANRIHEIQLPEGLHYAPAYLRKVRNAEARDKVPGLGKMKTRIVRCHPMGFEGDGAQKRKLLVPIVWAYPQGEMMVCAVVIETAQGTQIARTVMTAKQYYESPIGEIESL